MKRIVVIALTALVAASLALVAQTGTAGAATTKAVLGGGSGIITAENSDTITKNTKYVAACTLTVLARDQRGELFGLTAGHCANPGRYVYAEATPKAGAVGRVVARWKDIDIEVIRFIPNKVIPTKSRRGLTIKTIGRQAVGFPQTVCLAGRTSNKQCGWAWGADAEVQFTQMCANAGDSGAPVVAGTTLIGMHNALLAPKGIGRIPCLEPAIGTTISAIRIALKGVGITSLRVA